MKTGIELIAQERAEQIEKHGRTIQLDVEHNSNGQLIQAAYALLEGEFMGKPTGWNVDIWLHMICKPYKERVIIAGAFCVAELDRLNAIEDV